MKGTGFGNPSSGSGKAHDLVIVGGGISGLALAHFARRSGLGDLVVLEAGARPGGKVQTEWIDGYCCEWGPQGFLDNVPETLELADHLGLTPELVRAAETAKDRFIVRRGKLRRVPAAPPAFLFSDALSLLGRLRVLLEPFQPKGPAEESVLEFASRRIGRQAAEVLVDAMVTGVYAGDPAVLSLPSTFPRMREMEWTHGSLVRAMIAKARERRRSDAAERPAAASGPAGPGGTLTTFRRGMDQLTASIAAELGDALRIGCAAGRIHRRDGRFVLEPSAGPPIVAGRLAVAVPPRAAAELLTGVLGDEAVESLRAIPAVKVAVVMTGYRSRRPFAHPCRGFGFLVPGNERRGILGTIFNDSTFPCQAPAGHTLLRTLVGGARSGELATLPDADLLSLVRRELASLLGGDPEPEFVHIIRHDYAIPQYTLGHGERLAALDRATEATPGLVLTGNGLRGIALNSCVAEAKRIALTLAQSPSPAAVEI
jgi:oxygen-dependent protoporphyrinogen oxidase